MMKSLVLAATVLFSFAAKAADADKAGPCVHLRTFHDCVGYPTNECFWDASDNRCESRVSDPTLRCEALPYFSCVQNFACFWDASDNRCERR